MEAEWKRNVIKELKINNMCEQSIREKSDVLAEIRQGIEERGEKEMMQG